MGLLNHTGLVPQNAHGPFDQEHAGWVPAHIPTRTSAAGVSVTETTALGLPVYRACVQVIGNDVGKLPLNLYERVRQNGRKAKEKAVDHPVHHIINERPNPWTIPISFWESMALRAAAWHGAFAEIQKDGNGNPVALWPIHPSRVIPKLVKVNGVPVLFYDVHMNDQRFGPQRIIRFNADEIFHVRSLSSDGIHGLSVLGTGKDSIGLGLGAQTFASKFYANGWNAGGAIESASVIKPEVRDGLRESMDKMHKSVDKAYIPMILEDGLQFKPTSIPPNEAQFLESREFNVVDICRLFRIAPHKVQHLLRTPFRNIESQNIDHVGDALMPWLLRINQEVKLKLLKASERKKFFAEHELKALLLADSQARAVYMRTRFQMGSLTPNEIRAHENENPLDTIAADIPYIQSSMVPLIDAGKDKTNRPNTKSDPDDGGVEERDEKAAERAEQQRPFARSVMEKVMNREVTAMGRAITRCAGDEEKFAVWAATFATDQKRLMEQWLPPVASAVRDGFAADNAIDTITREYGLALSDRAASSFQDGMSGNVDMQTEALTDHFLENLIQEL